MVYVREDTLNMNNILVCVTQQKTCERLIRKAAELKSEYKGNLFVIHVVKNNGNFFDTVKEGEALEYLFGISKSVGANLFVLKSDEIATTIAEFSSENKIGCIVIGQSVTDKGENSFLTEMKSYLGKDVVIKIIP